MKLLCSLASLALSASLAHAYQQTTTQQLIGIWRLVSATQRLANGTERPSPAYGPHQSGYMIYTDQNLMCSVTVNDDRPKWQSPAAPTEAEMKSAWSGLGAYCAAYAVNEAEKSVTHHVAFDKLPNASGTDRKRFFTLSGNRLVLKIDPKEFSGGDVVEQTIVWERVKK
jgi:lipocalin-like protein